MKINYIITATAKGPSEDTYKSIEANLKEGDKITTVTFDDKITEEEVLNSYLSTLKEGEFTHITIINDGSLLRDFARTVFETYQEEGAVMLPMVELCNDINTGKVTFKGFLNASIWKPYFAESIGTLDLTLSVRGVDLILYGALIPTSIIQKFSFKPEIKYYSFFEYLSRLVHSNVPVLGIPKVTLRCIKDYELKDLPKDEKLAAFKLAQASYMA